MVTEKPPVATVATNMIVVLDPDAPDEAASEVVDLLDAARVDCHVVVDQGRQVVIAPGAPSDVVAAVAGLSAVERVVKTSGPAMLVSSAYSPKRTVIDVSGVPVGGETFVVIAGPCAVESRDQILEAAHAVKRHGARLLRGDAFKPRTSPYTFQGLGESALKLLADARDETGLPFVAEVLDTRDVELVAGYADMIRVGTRNMSNYALLRELGRQSKPVLLKRGRTATIDEWLSAAEHVYGAGNPNIVLVERGIRTFEPSTRNMLDITAVPLVRQRTHLPVLVDPSHAAGDSSLVPSLARAAMAAGADGLMVDVHPDPASALVDGDQALTPSEFGDMMNQLRAMAAALGLAI